MKIQNSLIIRSFNKTDCFILAETSGDFSFVNRPLFITLEKPVYTSKRY